MKLKVGIFDSGIGGFTILNSLLKTRNDVEVFYLADTKRIPYGNRNIHQIRSFAKDICYWFGNKNLDALLIACNTTNACALDILERDLQIPCFDLINSASDIVKETRIGVLATPTTVKSAYYEKVFRVNNKTLEIYQQECPEFVLEIERNKPNFNKLSSLADLYLGPVLRQEIQELILGCSHYPLIYNILRRKIDNKINIIDPSIALVNKFNSFFSISKNKLIQTISYDNVNFFVTSKYDEFSLKAKYWLEINKEINLVNLRSND